MFSKPDSRFFKQKYIDQTYAYFDKYGGRTLIVAQFIPFVRTYASVAAGVGKMPYRHFALFNAIGVVLWAGGVTMLGYLLGNITFIKENIEALLILVVLISVVPVDRRGLAQAPPRQGAARGGTARRRVRPRRPLRRAGRARGRRAQARSARDPPRPA